MATAVATTSTTAVPAQTLDKGNKSAPVRTRVEIIREYEHKNPHDSDSSLDMECENEDEYNRRMNRIARSKAKAARMNKTTPGAKQADNKVTQKPVTIVIDLDSDDDAKTPKKNEPAVKRAKVIYTDPKVSYKRRKRKSTYSLRDDDEIAFESSESEADEILHKSDDEFNPGKISDMGMIEKLRPRRKAAQYMQKKLKPWWEKIREGTDSENGKKEKVTSTKTSEEEEVVEEDEEYKEESDEDSEDISDDAEKGANPTMKIKLKMKMGSPKKTETTVTQQEGNKDAATGTEIKEGVPEKDPELNKTEKGEDVIEKDKTDVDDKSGDLKTENEKDDKKEDETEKDDKVDVEKKDGESEKDEKMLVDDEKDDKEKDKSDEKRDDVKLDEKDENGAEKSKDQKDETEKSVDQKDDSDKEIEIREDKDEEQLKDDDKTDDVKDDLKEGKKIESENKESDNAAEKPEVEVMEID